MIAGAAHWDDAYAQGERTRSWFQDAATPSLRMLDAAGVTAADSIVDVGGGASHLVDALLERGHRDVTVLDVSGAALELARRRLGAQASAVDWIVTDLLAWQPARGYRVWHDRALLHFMTDPVGYLRVLDAATGPDSLAVLATFAPDGPEYCSGLPVRRYAAAELAALLGDAWALVHEAREEHVTPAGAVQPFTWAALRRG